ncbi:hypothetical protein IMCC3317_13750 [Kordia antarctica]|uniref:Uncharacterized protein n=1 Tax=Kordia antarctica TaxID=1218801 RepID=A0A7L4ZHB8_9FLAO|nr:hypothetical protein [Kordia antarctica]QHI36022.1 hypothetical protein IMCC3317_13750 [Kordia antarctica]
MKKKFFLHKTVDALSEKQLKDLNQVFGGLATNSSDAAGIPNDDIIHYPTGGGGPRCPDGFYWHSGVQRCIKDGTYPHVPVDHAPMRLG